MDSVTEGGREEPAPQVAPDAVESTAPERAASNGRGRMLALISLATILVLAIWFSTNAVAPALEVEKGFSKTSLAWLTISVNLGFLAGTLVSSVLNLADIVNARRLFAISAVLGAALNLAVIPLDSLAAVLAVRFVTGAFLAGVYPSTGFAQKMFFIAYFLCKIVFIRVNFLGLRLGPCSCNPFYLDLNHRTFRSTLWDVLFPSPIVGRSA